MFWSVAGLVKSADKNTLHSRTLPQTLSQRFLLLFRVKPRFGLGATSTALVTSGCISSPFIRERDFPDFSFRE